MSRLSLFSLEDTDTSKQLLQEQETEITIFAKITNFEGLKESHDSEVQVQVESRLGEDHHCRVRFTKENGEDKYIFMFKVHTEGHGKNVDSRRENPLTVSKQFFDDFFSVADKVQNKVRYFFKANKITLSYRENDEDKVIEVPNVEYQVDVFTRPDGQLSDYCKIDVEVDSILQFIDHNYPEIKDINLNIKISDLPFLPTNGVVNEKDNKAVRSFVSHLYDTEFTTDLVKQRAEQRNHE